MTQEIMLGDYLLIGQDIEDLIERLEDVRDDPESRDLDEDEQNQLDIWTKFKNECEGCDDIGHIIFRREDTFADYCKELAIDMGAITGDEKWPLNCIDWEKAAREERHSYFEIEVNGHEYLYFAE